jgi:hypothetical protein
MIRKITVAIALFSFWMVGLENPNIAMANSCTINSESLSPSSVTLSSGSSEITWTVTAQCQSPYIHNTASGSGTMCNGGTCVAATATPVPNSYTYTYRFSLDQNSPAGAWSLSMTLRSSDGVTRFNIGSSQTVSVSAYVAPTTTTSTTTTTTSTTTTTTSTTTTTTVPSPSPSPTSTAATTTTTVASSGYYCLKPGGIGVNLVWINSSTINFSNPIYRTTPYTGVIVMTSATWNSKSDVEKNTYNMNEVAVKPIPVQGCSSLNQTLVLPTSTTLPSTTVPSSTSPTSLIGSTSTTTVSGSQASTNNSNKSITTTSTLPKPQISGVATTVPRTTKICPPSADNLFIYNYFYDGIVTNHGGRYDSSSSSSKFDWTRNCSVSQIIKLLIRDNFSVTETANLDLKLNFNKKVSNCWQVARVSAFGQSDWSNQVCYTVPAALLPQAPSLKLLDSTPPIVIPRGVTGAQCFDGFRTKVRSAAACKVHFGRDFWLFKKFKVGYNTKYSPSLPVGSVGGATGRCVGICYGVPSAVNGLPRNTYVRGYFRKDGTYVRPYTRSKP